MESDATNDRKGVLMAFSAAAAISLALHLLQPWGRFALYPFAMLATWAHEMGHGLTAELMGGEFLHLHLFQNLGGVAYHAGVPSLLRPVVAMGGLLGPALLGGAVIALSARSTGWARAVMVALAVAVAASWILWVRNLFGFFAVGGMTALLGAIALKGKPWLQEGVVQLCGIQLCLGGLGDFDYMFSKGFERGGQWHASDTQTMADVWLLPYWVWGGLIAGASVLIMLFAVYAAWLRPLREPVGGAGP